MRSIFMFYSILPESPRWLLTKGKQKEIHRIIHRIANVNKRKLPEDLEVGTDETNCDPQPRQLSVIKAVLTSPVLAARLVIVCFTWYASV